MRSLFLSLLLALPCSAASQDQEPQEALPLPESFEAAIELVEELDDALEGRSEKELRALVKAWSPLLSAKRKALDKARAADPGTPEKASAVQLTTDLDVLISGAETILDAIATTGGDVQDEYDKIDAYRDDEIETLELSTVPESKEAALALDVEVLRAQLRPLRRAQVEVQLADWTDFLQRSCIAVRNVEVAALRSEEADAVAGNSERAVKLRGERSRLLRRYEAVVDALEMKGGDVEEARAYMNSVIATPPITAWGAMRATFRTWVRAPNGGIATLERVGKAAALLLVFWFLSRILGWIAARATNSWHQASSLLSEFITSATRRGTLVAGLLIALSMLGLDMTPLLAAIGAAGLVIGLALQGTLGNLASGLMIMVYRPFDVADVVSTAGAMGTVKGMTLMTTTIKTFDNQTVHVPNSRVWGDVITNVTANKTRRVDLVFRIGYGDDVAAAKTLLEEIVSAHDLVLKEPQPIIRLHELAESSVNFIVRPWARTTDYWTVYWDLTEAVKSAFDERGFTVPFPQHQVHVIPAVETP